MNNIKPGKFLSDSYPVYRDNYYLCDNIPIKCPISDSTVKQFKFYLKIHQSLKVNQVRRIELNIL